jgi:hypothetical protein
MSLYLTKTGPRRSLPHATAYFHFELIGHGINTAAAVVACFLNASKYARIEWSDVVTHESLYKSRTRPQDSSYGTRIFRQLKSKALQQSQ